MPIKVPKNEQSWVLYCSNQTVMFVITSKKDSRDWYFLYSVSTTGDLQKIGKSHNPMELEIKYNIRERLLGGDKTA